MPVEKTYVIGEWQEDGSKSGYALTAELPLPCRA